ncbi:MAG: hypothetical protein ACW98Y_15990 [Candidatus Thorarchaeota archaeon]
MSAIDGIEHLLKGLDLHYIRSENALDLRWKTEHFEDLRIRIVTNENASWLYIIARFTSFLDVQESMRLNFALEMLKASWLYNGIKFAISPESDVIVLSQTNDTDLTGEELSILINNVVHGADVLWDISNSLGKVES